MNNENLRPLNMNKIKEKQNVFISSKEALKDVTPINWSNEVLSGKKKILVDTLK